MPTKTYADNTPLDYDKILSIIIPMYNAEKFIIKGLRSVTLSKDVKDKYEVIIVNDGSIDNSEKLVKEYAKEYPNIFKIYSKNNGGHGSAVNFGIEKSSGKYIKILDADDWMLTDELEKLIYQLEKIDVDVVATNYNIYDISSKSWKKNEMLDVKEENIYSLNDIVTDWGRKSFGFSIHGILYNSSFYKALNYRLPEKVFYDDACFITLACSHANKIKLLNKAIYVYRVGDLEQSISCTKKVERVDQLEIVIMNLLKHVDTLDDMSTASMKYWIYQTATAVSDYFATTFLRMNNKKVGREKAKKLKNIIKNTSRELYSEICKRYIVLKIMGLFHIKETLFNEITSTNAYRKLRRRIFSTL